jgi:hypothetical protein
MPRLRPGRARPLPVARKAITAWHIPFSHQPCWPGRLAKWPKWAEQMKNRVTASFWPFFPAIFYFLEIRNRKEISKI